MTGATRPVRGPLHSAAFLIETQVRIEIAATHRKQRKATKSNRNFSRGPGCAGEPAQKVVGPHVAERIFGADQAAQGIGPGNVLQKETKGRRISLPGRVFLPGPRTILPGGAK
jgi:hypothetical protein